MSESKRHDSSTDQNGETVRLRHGLHFNDCEATGHHSPIYIDYLCRDLRPHLLLILRELEIRASMVLAGEPRRRVLALLYDRQDNERDSLASFFIQCTDAATQQIVGQCVQIVAAQSNGLPAVADIIGMPALLLP